MINKRKRKNKTKRILYLILVIYVGCIFAQQQMYLLACQKDEDYYIKEIEKQKQIAVKYKNEEKNYQCDATIEKMARDKLGMVLSGEKVFVDMSK